MDGHIVLSLANQIVWAPELKGEQVLAVGAPGEWLPSAPQVLPANAIHVDLIAAAVTTTPRINELWEGFLFYCVTLSRQKLGFGRWFFHQFFSRLKVELHIQDHSKRQLVAEVVRNTKLLGPREIVEVNTSKE